MTICDCCYHDVSRFFVCYMCACSRDVFCCAGVVLIVLLYMLCVYIDLFVSVCCTCVMFVC